MKKDQLKSIMRRLSEVLVTLTLVFTFFLLLLFLLETMFPSGARVNEMIKRESLTAGGTGLDPWDPKTLISFGGKGSHLEASKEYSATLSKKENNTKSKRADAVAWVDAREGMRLYNRDAIQTSGNSSASIVFDAENYIQLGENSLLIIRRLEEDIVTPEKRSHLLIIDGEIEGKISGSEHKSIRMKLELPGGMALIRSKGLKGNQANFRISVNPDKSSTISMYQGEAEIFANGKTVKVKENQSTLVSLFDPPTQPKFLPKAPSILSPVNKKFYFRELPPRIRFTWAKLKGVSKYRFVLARDPFFEDILVDEKLSRVGFEHGNLSDGDYFWKVSALGEVGESAYSRMGQFQVTQDVEAPSLRVEFPSEILNENDFMLVGKTDREAKIYVGGKRVPTTSKGAFSHKLELQIGINIIVVEALDQAGNFSYRSKLVHAKIQ